MSFQLLALRSNKRYEKRVRPAGRSSIIGFEREMASARRDRKLNGNEIQRRTRQGYIKEGRGDLQGASVERQCHKISIG